MLNIVGHKKVFFIISGLLIIFVVITIIVLGFKSGIDLKGGTEWQFVFEREGVEKSAVEKVFEGKDVTILSRDVDDTHTFLVRSVFFEEKDHVAYAGILKEQFGPFEELRFESIGPAVGRELQEKALWAIVFVLLGISFYVAFAFRRASWPIRSWKYGVVTVLTLFHDVLIPAGFIAIMGKLNGVEVDVNFIVAILVIMGFSVHDTIVVFDRIRENLKFVKEVKSYKKDEAASATDFASIVNRSVNETLPRSINTSLTLVLMLLALVFFGPYTLYYFVLVILIGTVIGTYSSVFIASTLLVAWHSWQKY